MIRPTMSAPPPPPAWWTKAKEIAARAPSPVGAPFAARKEKKCAKVYIYAEIGKNWYGEGVDPSEIVKAIDAAADCDELEVHINSPGGAVFDGITVFNAIRSFKGTKTVYVDGLAASIASVIALAGDHVITNEGAVWMVHDPAWGVLSIGTADEIEEDARKVVTALRKMRENILDIYENATGQPRAALSALMAAETWLTAEEAKEHGFTDEVVKQVAAAGECECTCAECKASDCPSCSCGGCASCAESGGCNGGDCEQGGEQEMRGPPAPARARTPAELVAQARAERADLQRRFPGASPGPQHPGQPGANGSTTPVSRQKEAKR